MQQCSVCGKSSVGEVIWPNFFFLLIPHVNLSPGAFAPPPSATGFGPGTNAMNWSTISIPTEAREEVGTVAGGSGNEGSGGVTFSLLSSLDVDEVFAKILSRAKLAVAAERALLYVTEREYGEDGTLWTRFEQGSRPSRIPTNAGELEGLGQLNQAESKRHHHMYPNEQSPSS